MMILCGIVLAAALYAEENNFYFSGTLTNEARYTGLNSSSIFNKGNILDLPDLSYLIKFDLTGKGQLGSKSLNYYFKLRGVKNFSEDLDFYKDGQTYHDIFNFFSVDELYIDYSPSPKLYFLIGKQRIPWGNGIIFNPVDVINPFRYIFLPSREQEGAIIIKSEFLPSDFLNLTFYYNPELMDFANKFEYISSNIAARLNIVFSTIDLSLYYLQKFKYKQKASFPKMGLTISCTLPFGLNIYTDFIYEHESEYGYFNENFQDYHKNDHDLYSFLVGLSYFSQGRVDFSMIFEYYSNGKGCSARERENYFKTLGFYYEEIGKNSSDFNAPPSISNDVPSNTFDENFFLLFNAIGQNNHYYLNQHYIGLQVRLANIYDKIDIGSVFLYALSDTGFFINPSVDLNLSDHITTSLYSYISGGPANKYSQFGHGFIRFALGFAFKFVF
jgi:hypothetical protein